MRSLLLTLLFTAFFGRAIAQTIEKIEQVDDGPRHAITVEDMYALGRVGDPQLSPDGKTILYVVTEYSIEKNSSNSDIWSVPLAGGSAVRLTTAGGTDNSPRWSPDGKVIAFISSRDEGSQIWMMNTDGTGQRKITGLSTGIDAFTWSPTGTHLLFTSAVYPDCDSDDCNRAREEQRKANPVKAMIADRLPYRVWNAWKEGKFSHLFVVSAAGGKATDVTPGETDTPPIDLGGHLDFAVSPDGKEVAFVRNTERQVVTNTNNDIWIANLDGSNARCITAKNKANDNQPVYSPDGRFIAYRAMTRPGYEADRQILVLYERSTGATRALTADMDRSVDEVLWTPDSRRLLFTAQDGAYNSLFDVAADGGDVLRVLKGVLSHTYQERDTIKSVDIGTYRHDFRLHPDGKTLVFLGERMSHPADVMTAVYEGREVKAFRQVTTVNDEKLKTLDMTSPESFTFKSFDGTEVQGWQLLPPGYDPAKKYPLLLLIHGGPQQVWSDNFHYRWNAEVFAAPGFMVAEINCRGSQGFGQAFQDGVNGDWGGAPYKDLMAGVDYLLKQHPSIDRARMGAAGASYGGYMIDWMLGHTDRFKAFWSHAGVYDLVSMYGGTEELWFPEWEFRGTPWSNPKMYEKWSPSRYAKNFRTPTYVSNGQQDFRVPVEQGMQLFATLQRLGVESRFLYFPDEGHLVLKPRNAQLWYHEFREWFTKHLLK
jgi:dipeptidyl aminopeptidase/acylaminoacyl peptidase